MLGFLAEASPSIGTGHVVETRTLVREAETRGFDVTVWLNEGVPPGLLATFPPCVRRVPGIEALHVERVASEMRELGVGVALTNLRAVSNAQVQALADATRAVLCIDEWGNRRIDCDVVINPTPVARHHRYTSCHPKFRLYTGLDYLALSSDYLGYRARARAHHGPLRSLAVAMGGMDRTGIAVRLVETLLAVRPELEMHVMVGAGFMRHEEIEAMRARAPLHLHRALPSLADVLVRCDAGFTVGGNTLLEMACVGTPALVLYEEAHEREQSAALATLGFGRCLGPAASLDHAAIAGALTTLDDPHERARQAEVGRRLVDANGARRILDLAVGLLDEPRE